MDLNMPSSCVVSLPRETCNQPTNLQEQLPETALNAMNQALAKPIGQYTLNDWPIVAARPRHRKTRWQHSEWRLLHRGKNSSVAQLKARTCRPNCCLILFTLNSPCTSMCLAENGPYNILSMTSDAFLDIDSNYKAFVFQRIFCNDTWPVVTRQELLEAWHQLHDVPLLRCAAKTGLPGLRCDGPRKQPLPGWEDIDSGAGPGIACGSFCHWPLSLPTCFWLAEYKRNTSQPGTKLQSRTPF
ncbi:unnamed protein product [Lepidochelys olivacea]